MEKTPNQNESLSKAEIDKQIEELESARSKTLSNRQTLADKYEELCHQYQESNEALDEFKESKVVLEERIENPTLPDKLRRGFNQLIGKDENTDSKEGFLANRENTTEALDYQADAVVLRRSVGQVAESKHIIKELFGGDLDFRGGSLGGGDTPRSESFRKIEEKIKEFDTKASEEATHIKAKRDDAYEAWKRENPKEWAAVHNKEQSLLAFEELLQSSPTSEELTEVFRKTQYLEIKEKVKSQLLEKANPNELLYLFSLKGFYTRDLLNQYLDTVEKVADQWRGDNRTGARARIICSELYRHSAQEEIIDRLVERLPDNCYAFGNGESCIHGGCCMMDNYFQLPVNVQTKIVESLENSGSKRASDIAEHFTTVHANRIDDPIARSKYILGLGLPRRNGYHHQEYSKADGVSGEMRHFAAKEYLKSGEKDVPLLLLSLEIIEMTGDQDEVLSAIRQLVPILKIDKLLENITRIDGLLDGKENNIGSLLSEDVVRAFIEPYIKRERDSEIKDVLFSWDFSDAEKTANSIEQGITRKFGMRGEFGGPLQKRFIEITKQRMDEYKKQSEREKIERDSLKKRIG